MPNLDGGHYFLTLLAPVRTGNMIDPVTGASRSHPHLLRQALALLSAGRQTAASPPDAPPSPFARNTLNHLTRFVMIDGPAYNGRESGDSLVGLLHSTDPLVAQPVDVLTTPFLLFAADVDAQSLDGPTALRRYTDTLWTTMRPELDATFGHCLGFDTVTDAAAFNAYVVRCQIETTMPFNDYWADGLVAPAAPLGAVAAVAAVVVAAALYVAVTRGWPGIALALGMIALLLYGAWRFIIGWGARPFPTAPDSDLPSVLKALFLQQAFTSFASKAQGLDDATLHAHFGTFLAATDPAAASPALFPGEVAAPQVEWTL
ncbi:hypothetical protein KZX46_03900 [Polymorphobacter sp. PAMC 29334]|uniref:hypothetical protein n=1 Tax=Polymorphobacter sp. PAMC 29334 TaxID=2862331 RepID=UPI001C784141|nr:hypothetical protein [Polymorphobacter sp. PAMC 29334]QYE35163.1 hypothetical protein KZX46_03900 [Polymorphobacter sp. PAMC 29334]